MNPGMDESDDAVIFFGETWTSESRLGLAVRGADTWNISIFNYVFNFFLFFFFENIM